MTTITKERLLTIKQWRETYGPGSNVVLPAEEAEELARIALASLEAKPIGAFHIAEQQVDGTSDYLKDGEWPIDNGIIEVYAAPPVPVVPEEKPMPNPLSMYAVDAVAAIAEVRGWNACRAAMLQSGNFRENKNSSTNNFREIAETSTNYPVIPSEVLSAILKVAKIRADFDDFDGDRRGIGDCLDEAEQELIVTINKYASQLAAEPIAPNDVREQTAVPPIQADVAQAIENLKQKLVECNRYNYCADAVKNVEDACHAAMLHSAEPASNHEELPLDYLQGQKDGLEWAAQLAEANHPQTGDWLYDDPLELAKAIRKGPDMPEFDGPTPVTPDGWISCSERMPDKLIPVMVMYEDGEMWSAMWNGNRWDDGTEYPDPHSVTHWREMPAAPQQEVK
ncbi:Eaa protein [Escherichia coli]|nr:Eaa protein [Escherichia coli]CTX17458.1 Eaa protein [Escherichia coli]